MRVLVTGAYGFIGGHVLAALQEAGHQPVCAVRHPYSDVRFNHLPAVGCDFRTDLTPGRWHEQLRNIDAVVNAAGLLRDTPRGALEKVNRDAPVALFQACAEAGVRLVIQISALGSKEDGAFITTKHAADADLQVLDLDWVILRPSVVYSTAGSYGGTSLLRALAALPGCLSVPGNGEQRLQPIRAEDLAYAVCSLLQPGAASKEIFEATGPEPVSIARFLTELRKWLGVRTRCTIHVPDRLVRIAAGLGQHFGSGPLANSLYHMLQRGNIATPGAAGRFADAMGFKPLSLTDALHRAPSHVQDRWHARLYLLAPFLRAMLGLVWIASGLLTLRDPQPVIELWGYGAINPAIVTTAALADLLIGVAVLAAWRTRLMVWLMGTSLAIYTAGLTFLAPGLWLDPGLPMLKNVMLFITVLVYAVIARRR